MKYHFKEYKSILSAKNGMNIYRGCQHGCIYCDARSTCYQMNHDFEDIEVKANAPTQLEGELKKRRKLCMIGTGAMSDPYIPLEKELFYTRKCLEVIESQGFGVTIQTKSDLILRDLDLLKRINSKAKAVVQMTLTTYDEGLCRILEPNVSTTRERFEALKIFKENGIPTVVWLCPILPFINDTEENIFGILDYCHRANVYGIINFGMGLTLRDGDREYFYNALDRHFLQMKERYMQRYGNNYQLPSDNQSRLFGIFYRKCNEYNIETDPNKIFKYLQYLPEKEEELSFFDW